LLDVLNFEDNVIVPKKVDEKPLNNNLQNMSIDKLQGKINSKLTEAKNKYSAVMKYSIP
jgi:hypothetical protein